MRVGVVSEKRLRNRYAAASGTRQRGKNEPSKRPYLAGPALVANL
jgi:hypothetical protein